MTITCFSSHWCIDFTVLRLRVGATKDGGSAVGTFLYIRFLDKLKYALRRLSSACTTELRSRNSNAASLSVEFSSTDIGYACDETHLNCIEKNKPRVGEFELDLRRSVLRSPFLRVCCTILPKFSIHPFVKAFAIQTSSFKSTSHMFKHITHSHPSTYLPVPRTGHSIALDLPQHSKTRIKSQAARSPPSTAPCLPLSYRKHGPRSLHF
jgi:hypothetical protein